MLSRELVCVVYHDISDEPGPYLQHLNISTKTHIFQNHLRYFKKNYNVVDVEAVLSGKLPDRSLLITFDDSFRSTLEIAAPLMKENSLPGAVFLNPAMVTEKGFCIDNLLSFYACSRGIRALSELTGGATAESMTVTEFISRHVSQMSIAERRALKHRILQRLSCREEELWDESSLYLRTEDIKAFKHYGLEVGNHTTNHVYCRNLRDEEAKVEIRQSKEILEELSGAPIRAFAFPYGNKLDATRAILKEIRQSGHTLIFLVHARSNWKRPSRDMWYRVSLTNENTRRLLPKLRILPKIRSGLLPRNDTKFD